jgi:metal-sulfur cluster biosynthetic enzyme
MAKPESIKLTRVTEAIEIPYGTRVMVPMGTTVTVTQALGDTYTVKTEDGYLVRIADKDADALGKEPGALAAAAQREAERAAGGGTAGAAPAPALGREELEAEVWRQLETIFDPEIPVNVVDLGLIYECRIAAAGEGRYRVDVTMTLTAPGCGMGDILKEDAAAKLRALPGVQEVHVEMTFDPPWEPSRMSDAARLALNMF